MRSALKTGMTVLLSVAVYLASGQSDSLMIFRQIENARSAGDVQSRIEILEKAKASADEERIHSLSIQARKELAPLYLETGNNYEGLRLYFQLESSFQKNQAYSDLYSIYKSLSKYYESIELYNNSSDYELKALDLIDKGYVLNDPVPGLKKMGELKLRALEFEEALEVLNRADALLLQVPNDNLHVSVLRLKGKSQEKLGLLEDALRTNERILKILDRNNLTEEHIAQLNNLGFLELKLGNDKKALDYFLETLERREKEGYTDPENLTLLINIGITYQNLRMINDSKVFLQRAEKATEKDDIATRGHLLDLISISYLSENDLYNALEYNREGLSLMDGSSPETEMELCLTASIIHEKILEYDEALEYYKRYLTINDSLDVQKLLTQEELMQKQVLIEKTEKEIQSLNARNEIKDYELEQLRLESENKDIQLKNQQLDAQRKLQELKIREQDLEQERTEKELEATRAREENQRLLLKQKELEEADRIKELQLAEKQVEIQDLELAKRKSLNRNLSIIAILAVILTTLAIFAFVRIRRSNRIIHFEKVKSDNLLLNILPKSTADELKAVGQSLPRKYDKVAVLFTDFKGFTTISENMTPELLVESLDLFFAGFDDIMKKHGLEKIKTIGDAYMCAGGIPEPIEDASMHAVRAAQEMIRFTNEINEKKKEAGQPTWGIRIGIHTGPLVAGVIGNYKFQYDIWGDTVNLAARMESSGEPGKINISESTYVDIMDQIPCTYRGEIEAKNKGKVKMYFVGSD